MDDYYDTRLKFLNAISDLDRCDCEELDCDEYNYEYCPVCYASKYLDRISRLLNESVELIKKQGAFYKDGEFIIDKKVYKKWKDNIKKD